MNVFTGIGRLGRDAEVRYTQAGTPVTTFAVAIEDGFGGNKTTTWLDCAMFGERGEKIAGYIRKGDRIGVTGSIRLDTYTTRDGVEKSKVALRVVDVTLLGGKQDRQDAPRSEPRPSGGTGPAEHTGDDFDDDDIPFISNRSTY
jgi:single-strand DNA-binding protein